MIVRTVSAKVRLLALTIAVAIAVPANLPDWPGAEETAPASPVARADSGPPGLPTLSRVTPRPSWHGAGLTWADPSDEPDEGSDGWVHAPSLSLPAPAILRGAIADRLGAASIAPARSPLPPGATCRLRC